MSLARAKRPHALLASACLLAVGLSAPLIAGTFSGAGETSGVDLVRHPLGYDGTAGMLTLSVCLDPAASDPDAEYPLQLAIRTWIVGQGTTSNISSSVGVPMTHMDFQSVALRGLGLCLGLDDPADGSGFTRATNGANDTFDLDAGSDSVPGTADDLRGDDESLFWFRVADNLPFTESMTVDSTTFTRDPGLLPEGENFPNTSTRAVALQLGFVGTEAVMVNGLQPGEAKRALSWDDRSTLRYGESGLDELEGTGDDYQVHLSYLGRIDSEACDISITFEKQEDLVACPGFLGAVGEPDDGHYTANLLGFLAFSDGVSWYYGDHGSLFFDGFETGDLSRW